MNAIQPTFSMNLETNFKFFFVVVSSCDENTCGFIMKIRRNVAISIDLIDRLEIRSDKSFILFHQRQVREKIFNDCKLILYMNF